MKRFIFNISAGFVFVILIYFISLNILFSILKNHISNSEIIILGDSHTQHLNIPNSFNYSIRGASYVLHYNFIKQFKKEIKGKKILFSVSSNNLANYKEYKFKNVDKNIAWINKTNKNLNLLSIFPTKKFNKFEWREKKIIDFDVLKNLVEYYYLNHIKINKSNEKFAQPSNFAKTINRHFGDSISIINDRTEILYLEKSLLELESNKCNIFLYNSPKTDYYNINTPKIFKNRIDTFLNKKNEKYFVLNYHNFNSSNLLIFRDADHMNHMGEIKISKIILDEINQLMKEK